MKRIRPFNLIEELTAIIPPPPDWSFPSGHTTSSVATAIILYKHMSKTVGISGIIIAFLISVSRIYLGVHYPSDILAGAAAGTVAAITAEKMMQKKD